MILKNTKFYAFPNKTVELHFRLKVPGGETDIKIPFEKSDLTDMIKQIIKYNPNHIPYILETITTITQNIIKEKDALEDN